MSNWRIAADVFTLCLQRRYVAGKKAKRPGTVTWQPECWPGNLEQTALQLLETLTVEKAAARDIKDTRKLIDVISEAREDVIRAVAEYTGQEAAS